MGLGGLAQRTQATAADIAEALSVSAPPAQPAAQPAPAAPGLPPPSPNGLAVQPPPRDPGASMLGTMTDFKSPPLAAALQGARGREGPTGFARGGFVVRL